MERVGADTLEPPRKGLGKALAAGQGKPGQHFFHVYFPKSRANRWPASVTLAWTLPGIRCFSPELIPGLCPRGLHSLPRRHAPPPWKTLRGQEILQIQELCLPSPLSPFIPTSPGPAPPGLTPSGLVLSS